MPVNLKLLIFAPLFAGASITGVTLPIVYINRNSNLFSGISESELSLQNLYDNTLKKEEIGKLFKKVGTSGSERAPDDTWIEKFRNAVNFFKNSVQSEQEVKDQECKSEHREALLQMYLFYTNLRGKIKNSTTTDNVPEFKVMDVSKSLDSIEWCKTEIKRFKEENNENNGWGWGAWSENPFNKFFNSEYKLPFSEITVRKILEDAGKIYREKTKEQKFDEIFTTEKIRKFRETIEKIQSNQENKQLTLSTEERELLSSFYAVYSLLDKRTKEISENETNDEEYSNWFKNVKAEIVLSDLNELNWDSEQLSFKEITEETNPSILEHLSKDIPGLKEKLQKSKDQNITTDVASSEIVFEISNWLVKEMEIIHKDHF